MRKGDKIFLIIVSVFMFLHISGTIMEMQGTIDYGVDNIQWFTSIMIVIGIPFAIYKIIQHRKKKSLNQSKGMGQ